MKDKAYEEIGPNYRFFLAWRHAAFGGGLIVLWGACSLLTSAFEKGVQIAWLIPLLSALVTLCLWLADHRTRQIYRSITEAGKKLEGDEPGPYHALTDIGIPKNAPWFPRKDNPHCKLFSQSFALDFFFLGSSVVLLLVAGVLFFRPPETSESSRPTPPSQGTQVQQ